MPVATVRQAYNGSGYHNPSNVYPYNYNRRNGYRNQRYMNNHQAQSYNGFDLTYSQDGHRKLDYSSNLTNLVMPKCSVSTHAEYVNFKGDGWYPKHLMRHHKNIQSRIGSEIEKFYQFFRPLTPDYLFRRAIFRSIRHRIRKNFPSIQVQFYGSFSSGTYLPISDIDLIINTKACNDQSKEPPKVLEEIAETLLKEGMVQGSCLLIDRCRIPILKFNDSITGIPINISIDPEHARSRTYFIRNKFANCSYMYRILSVMKYYHAFKSFNEVYHGGISSYSLALMVISYFETSQAQKFISENWSYEEKLGHLLLGFLEYFGNLDFVHSHIFHVGKQSKTYPYVEEMTSLNLKAENGSYYNDTFLKIRDDYSKNFSFVSGGSFRAKIILEDFNEFRRELLSKKPNHDKCLFSSLFVISDSLNKYREALHLLYEKWFGAYTGRDECENTFVKWRNYTDRDLKAMIISGRNSANALIISRLFDTCSGYSSLQRSEFHSVSFDSLESPEPLSPENENIPTIYKNSILHSTPKKAFNKNHKKKSSNRNHVPFHQFTVQKPLESIPGASEIAPAVLDLFRHHPNIISSTSTK